jgi:MoaA/NifB/PqqE/SkfB family radical SAM enzyme
LPLDILDRIVAEAKATGFEQLAFTGGDPTVHPQFPEVLRRTFEAGYQFSIVTNGWNFVSVYPRILPYREQLSIITFSLDGATEATHDRLRGKGSYQRVMRAISVCVAENLPFTFNMMVTAHNRHELAEMARLAARLGSRGLRFGHLMPALLTTLRNFDLSPAERKEVEAEVRSLVAECPVPIVMAPGYFTTSLFPCTPLQMQEVNIDCRGNMTKCCQLSGHGEGVGQADIIGNLRDMSFARAYQQMVKENEQFREQKMRHLASGSFKETDFFPCWYCSLYYKKVDWLKQFSNHAWSGLIREIPLVEGVPPAPVGESTQHGNGHSKGAAEVLTMLSRATPHPDVLDTTLGNGEVVVLHLGTNQYYSLNETGACIWQRVKEGLSLGAICREIQDRYEVSAEQAQECILALAHQLVTERLLQPVSDERSLTQPPAQVLS